MTKHNEILKMSYLEKKKEHLSKQLAKLKIFFKRNGIFNQHSWRCLFLTTFSGLSLTFVEVGLAAGLQVFFKKMGLFDASIAYPDFLDPFVSNTKYVISGLITLALLRGFFQFLNVYSAFSLYNFTNSFLRRVILFEMLLRKDPDFIPSSDNHFKIGELFPKASLVSYSVSQALSQIIQCLGLGFFLVRISWQGTLFGLVCIALIAQIVTFLNRRVRNRSIALITHQQVLVRGLERIARNWMLVKTLRTQEFEFQKLSTAVDKYAHNHIVAKGFSSFATVLPNSLGVIVTVMLVLLNDFFWHTPAIEFISFLYLFLRFVQSCSNLATSLGELNSNFPQFELAANYVDRFSCEELGDVRLNHSILFKQKPKNIVGSLPPQIVAKKISYAYPKSTKRVIENISFYIQSGMQFGFRGASGSGKSTILRLILGLAVPGTGSISIDNKSALDFFTGNSSQIGYVGAEPFLIEGTIRDNLLYGARQNHSDEELYNALRMAKLEATILKLENQLDYFIHETGEGLSAGQKQRLSLARAFLENPKLLVLDEASANLDEKTELEIAETISQLKGRCTVIIVSHRPGLLSQADQILDLQPA